MKTVDEIMYNAMDGFADNYKAATILEHQRSTNHAVDHFLERVQEIDKITDMQVKLYRQHYNGKKGEK